MDVHPTKNGIYRYWPIPSFFHLWGARILQPSPAEDSEYLPLVAVVPGPSGLMDSMDWFEGNVAGKPHDLHGKIYGFQVTFPLKPIHWLISLIFGSGWWWLSQLKYESQWGSSALQSPTPTKDQWSYQPQKKLHTWKRQWSPSPRLEEHRK